MASLSPSALRSLILNFYSEHDPIKLQQGLDVNGIVEWTMRNGIEKLNQMLYKQFGQTIDPRKNTGNLQQQFSRMSAALTPALFAQSRALSANISKKQNQIKKKLFIFYHRHDPSRLLPQNQEQLERIVNFALYHGIEKLNIKLETKYGEGLPLEEDLDDGNRNGEQAYQGQMGNGAMHGAPAVPDRQLEVKMMQESAATTGIDLDRLEDDLRAYFHSLGMADQLQLMDEVIDWVVKMGFEQTNEKFEQLYGTSFDDELYNLGRQPYCEPKEDIGYEEAYAPIPTQAQDSPRVEPNYGGYENYEEEVNPYEREERNETVERSFPDMSDAEIVSELRAFYTKHDPDNITRLGDVLKLARKLGRHGLNEKLVAIYGEKLSPDLRYEEMDYGYEIDEPDAFQDLENDETASFNMAAPARGQQQQKPPVPRRVAKNRAIVPPPGNLPAVTHQPRPSIDNRTQNPDHSHNMNHNPTPGQYQYDPAPHPHQYNAPEVMQAPNVPMQHTPELWDNGTGAPGKPSTLQHEKPSKMKRAGGISSKLKGMFGKKKKDVGQTEITFITSQVDSSFQSPTQRSPSFGADVGTPGNPGAQAQYGSTFSNPQYYEAPYGQDAQSNNRAVASSPRRLLPGMTALPGMASPEAFTPSTQRAAPNYPSHRYDSHADYDDTAPPPVPASGFAVSSAPPVEVPRGSFSSFTGFFGRQSSNPGANGPGPKKEKVVRAERYGVEVNGQMNEITKRALAIRERNMRGESLVTGYDGRKEIINILAECDKYELDVLTGVCATCGLPKGKHSSNAKLYKPKKQMKENKFRKTNGQLNVAALVSQVNKTGHRKGVKPTFQKPTRKILPPSSRVVTQLRAAPVGNTGQDQYTLLTSSAIRMSWRNHS